MRKHPDRPCGNHGFVVAGEFFKSRDRFFTVFFESLKTEEAGVDGGTFEGGDGSFDGVEVEFRDAGFEILGSNPVDGAGAGIVAVAVATDAGVIPIGNVKGAIGADADVRRAEEDFGVAGIRAAADEIGAGVFFIGVGGDEVVLLQLEGGTLWLGFVVEDGVFSGFAGEK